LFTLCLCAQDKHEEALEHSRKFFFADPKNKERFSIYFLALNQAAASGKYDTDDLFDKEEKEFHKASVPTDILKNASDSMMSVDKRPQRGFIVIEAQP